MQKKTLEIGKNLNLMKGGIAHSELESRQT